MYTRCKSTQYLTIMIIGFFLSSYPVRSATTAYSPETGSLQDSTNGASAESDVISHQLLLASLTKSRSPIVIKKLLEGLKWKGQMSDFIDNLIHIQAESLARFEQKTTVLVSKQFALCDFLFSYLLQLLWHGNCLTDAQRKRFIEMSEEHRQLLAAEHYSTPLRAKQFSGGGKQLMFNDIDEWYSLLFRDWKIAEKPERFTRIDLWPRVRDYFLFKIQELQVDSKWVLSSLLDLQTIEIGIQSSVLIHPVTSELNSILQQTDDGDVKIVSLSNGKQLYNLIAQIENTTLSWLRSIETLFYFEITEDNVHSLVSDYLASLDRMDKCLSKYARYLRTLEDSASTHKKLTENWCRLISSIETN